LSWFCRANAKVVLPALEHPLSKITLDILFFSPKIFDAMPFTLQSGQCRILALTGIAKT
jgi:hypothetical protein